MNERDKENLKDLFERFLDAQDAQKRVEDIRKGEDILREHPSPEPGREVIARIKAEIERELNSQKTRITRRVVYKVAGVAAVFLILATVSVKLFEKDAGQQKIPKASQLPPALWESEDLSKDDLDLAILAAEIDEMEGEALALQLGENRGNGHIDVAELETELLEIDSDFWKG